jgi:prepilin-type N-terminal cleavage/methylation domain-containing protein
MHRLCRGFTLVELLVVIVIIGVLVALLVPAVLSAREAARQTQCVNNQQQIYKAVVQYELAKGRYPGALNPPFPADTQNNRVNWVMALLPYVGRNDLWEGDPTDTNVKNRWRHGIDAGTNPTPGTNGPAPASKFQVALPLFACPDDPAEGDIKPWLSYVVNANVFMDRTLAQAAGKKATYDMSASRIRAPDRTIMLGERYAGEDSGLVHPGPWTDVTQGTPPPYLTFLLAPPSTSNANMGPDNKTLTPSFFSCRHPGIVILTFFDGNTEKVSDSAVASDYYRGP